MDQSFNQKQPASLEELLQQCTVKLTLPELHQQGTGFFVAPNLILTCNHVVSGSAKLKCPEGRRVSVRWQNQENFIEARVIKSVADPVDLVLLSFEEVPGVTIPYVYFDVEIGRRQNLYSFGYPDIEFPNGFPLTLSYVGLTGDDPPYMIFNREQVRPGMSGAALLNQGTGRVCGIVKFTRAANSDLGGGGISARTILSEFPELAKHQQEFYQTNSRWRDLASPVLPRPSPIFVGFVSVIITIIVIALRTYGGLQLSELWLYDQLMLWRGSDEKQDDRILIVGVEGVEEIGDRELIDLLEQIKGKNPSSIGLDIHRNNLNKNDDHLNLVNYLKKHENIISTCLVDPTSSVETESANPPFTVGELREGESGELTNLAEYQLGFTDAIADKPGDIIRRHLLTIVLLPTTESKCQTDKSLSLQLARDYLFFEHKIPMKIPDSDHVRFGEVSFNKLQEKWGGYQKRVFAEREIQIMLNYRYHESIEKAFDIIRTEKNPKNGKVRIRDNEVLSQITNRIVLIGYTSPNQIKNNRGDLHKSIDGSLIPGVVIQAHMTSQIISAALDSRPLIWVFPEWVVVLWIVGWSTLGGVLVYYLRSLQLLGATLIVIVLLLFFCLLTLKCLGAWIPVIPSSMSFLLVIILVPPAEKYIKLPIS